MRKDDRMEELLQLLSEVCGEHRNLFAPDLDLLESELLDSLAFIELLEGIEDHFGVTLEPTRIPHERWRTAGSILRLVDEAMGEGTAP